MFNVGCLPCCFGVRGGACVQADVPRAQLSSGTILGEYVGGSEHFSAVPFAAPPVGIRRWKKPEPVEPWPGELDCSSRRPPDDRRGRPVQSVDPEHDRQPTEDCLHLDIWFPMGTLGSLSRSPKGLPVLVWIYGGGLLSGSKDDPGSSGQCYAEQGIIFICINYRVGALGFLCPRHADPNCGLWDQACALQWIQNEIGNLGGDPKKVTIMGQSAGGDSVYWCEPPPLSSASGSLSCIVHTRAHGFRGFAFSMHQLFVHTSIVRCRVYDMDYTSCMHLFLEIRLAWSVTAWHMIGQQQSKCRLATPVGS